MLQQVKCEYMHVSTANLKKKGKRINVECEMLGGVAFVLQRLIRNELNRISFVWYPTATTQYQKVGNILPKYE